MGCRADLWTHLPASAGRHLGLPLPGRRPGHTRSRRLALFRGLPRLRDPRRLLASLPLPFLPLASLPLTLSPLPLPRRTRRRRTWAGRRIRRPLLVRPRRHLRRPLLRLRRPPGRSSLRLRRLPHRHRGPRRCLPRPCGCRRLPRPQSGRLGAMGRSRLPIPPLFGLLPRRVSLILWSRAPLRPLGLPPRPTLQRRGRTRRRQPALPYQRRPSRPRLRLSHLSLLPLRPGLLPPRPGLLPPRWRMTSTTSRRLPRRPEPPGRPLPLNHHRSARAPRRRRRATPTGP